MTEIITVLGLDEDVGTLIANMVREFPKGSRVKVAISEVPPAAPLPRLEDYRRGIAMAREKVPGCPWKTTSEGMKALREGEGD